MASEPIMGVWWLSPQWGPEAKPLVRGLGGRSPLRLKALFYFKAAWMLFFRAYFNQIHKCLSLYKFIIIMIMNLYSDIIVHLMTLESEVAELRLTFTTGN